MSEVRPVPKKGTKLACASLARRLLRLPLKETKQLQARDPQGASMPEPMDVSPREATQPFLSPRSSQSQDSVHTLCYKLDLESDDIERPPRLDHSTRRDSNSSDMGHQTAQIFRGVEINEDGTIVAENSRATRSNAGKQARKVKRSRQAENILKARDLVDEIVDDVNGGESTKSPKVLSLYVVGGYDDMGDLIRFAPRKLRKLEPDNIPKTPNESHLALNSPPRRAPTPRKVTPPRSFGALPALV